MVEGTLNAPRRYTLRARPSVPSKMVENGADAWREGQGEPKNNFT